MYYLAEPLIQWRRHQGNQTDRLMNKTSTSLVFSETKSAYDVGAMIYMLEDLWHFSKSHDDKACLGSVNRKLVGQIIQSTRQWTQHWNNLVLNGQRPTWVDKAELEKNSIVDSFRLQPQD